MKTVKVYGASDDLIEIEGDLYEEFGCYDEKGGKYLGFSDGTVLHIVYGQGNGGFWRITQRAVGTATCTIEQGMDEDTDYSDRATLQGDITWVVCGDLAKAKQPAEARP